MSSTKTKQAVEETFLVCPECFSGSSLKTVEVAEAISDLTHVTREDGLEFDGHTEYLGDTLKTVGIICHGCGWEHFAESELELVAQLVVEPEENEEE